MKIMLNKKDVIGLIKNYYKEVYSIKSCNVKIKSEKIKDRLREIDLFHNDQIYYNILFRTNISGIIIDKQGKKNKYFEELNMQGTKDIIKKALSNRYDIQDIQCGVQFYRDSSSAELEPKFTHMVVDVNTKDFKKLSMIREK